MTHQKTVFWVTEMNDRALSKLAKRIARELDMRGLPDVSFKQGYKAGFLAALCDEDYGPGQVWSHEESEELFRELDRRFAA